ncbi:MAG TPA: CBS domain-containing protein [Blastocatellia bacterium]|jgi:CBS domain-containing protein|nr:CBS domain-containing protein [Blastocatellia bacterium]HAF23629.1 CBS domain-containing protein [Blastocatellia bacterium]HCX30003.1 CBS domain-containing protein [Blastocatellia bacterium]
MKVKEIMTKNAKACTPISNLAEAAGLMWENDCGILPVVAHGGRVVGLITDRDVCMAAALQHRDLENIAVAEVTSGKVVSCHPDDDVRTALKTMQENKVRRLPVVADDGTLAGILSMNDIVVNAKEIADKQDANVSYADVVQTYKAICAHAAAHQQATQPRAAGV